MVSVCAVGLHLQDSQHDVTECCGDWQPVGFLATNASVAVIEHLLVVRGVLEEVYYELLQLRLQLA